MTGASARKSRGQTDTHTMPARLHATPSRARRAWVGAGAILAMAATLLAPGSAGAASRDEVAPTPDVAAACDSSSLVRPDGTVWSWGTNTLGQLGDGSTTSGEAPRQVLTAAATPLTNVITVAQGCTNGYAVRGDGSVWAWGSNLHGQLGGGSAVGPATCGATPCSTYAVRVQTAAGPTYLGNVTALAAGASHVLARRSDGTVWAWGRGDSGQLGNQSTTGPATCAGVGCSTYAIRVSDPADPTGYLTSILDVAAGDATSIAMRVDGLVRAWGDDTNGATGRGSTSGTTLNPTAVEQDTGGFPQLDRVRSIDGAGRTFRALRSDGTMHTWGAGAQGQLGNATNTASQPRSVAVLAPAGVLGLDRVREVSGSADHVVAIRADGSIWTWGRNDWGQIGDLSQTQRTRPVQVADSTTPTWLTLAMHVAAGSTHSIAVLADGTIRSWGDDQLGQLGLAAPPPSCGVRVCSLYARTGAASAGTGYRAVAASMNTSYAIAANGTVRAWGENTDGQAGIGIEDGFLSSPTTVLTAAATPLTGIVAISAGADNGFALRADGTVWAWGDGLYGQLGRGSTSDSNFAQKVQASAGVDLADAIAIGAIDRASIQLGVDGRLRAVGRNTYGVLGDNSTTQRTYPVLVQQLSGADLDRVVGIGGDGGDVDHISAVRDDGTLWSWGMNNYGQLGLGVSSGPETCSGQGCSSRARQVLAAAGTPLTGVATATNSYYAGHALKFDGTVWSWGVNVRGEIGNATTSTVSVPYAVRVATNDTNTTWIETATAITSGNYTPLAVLADGSAMGWGSNTQGEVGDSSFVSPRRFATAVSAIGGGGQVSMIAQLESGGEHNVARTAAGQLLTWGRDHFGQLGACTATYDSRRWPDLVQETCGSNLPPRLVSDASQYRSDTTTQLPIGTWTNETTIVVKADVADPDSAQSMRLFVEIRPNNVAFSAACGAIADPAVFQSSASGSITQGDSVWQSVTITGLTSGIQYHWRACVRDAAGLGLSSPFYSPGGNPDISVDTSTPAPGTFGVRQVAAGCDNTGVVLADGTVWMAGDGTYGQLGNGTTSGSSGTPVQVRLAPAGVSALTSVRSLAIGCGFAVAVRTDGTVYAWGRNDTAQLGAGTATSCGGTNCSEWAVQVDPANATQVKAVAAGGGFALALRADGRVLAWGSDANGRLGRNSVGGSSATAAPVRNTANTADLANVTSIAAADDFAVASDASGAAWAWGSNTNLQLGAGLVDGTDYPTARAVLTAAATPIQRIKRVSAGDDHALALRDDGTLWSWGSNSSGQLGINAAGGTGTYAAPVRDGSGTTLTRWRDMVAGQAHSVAVRADGTIWSWGLNTKGQLGQNSYTGASCGATCEIVPVQTRDSGGVVIPDTTSMARVIAAGTVHTALVRADGQAFAWGRHDRGQLARTAAVGTCPTAEPCAPSLVTSSFSTGGGAIQVAGLGRASALLRADGTIRAWGDNNYGVLGTGTSNGQTPRLQTVEVSAGVPLANVVHLIGAEYAMYAVLADGTVWSWGNGGSGRLGNNSSSTRTRAVQVRSASAASNTGPPLVDVIDVAAHDEGAFALDASGVAWSWGDNDYGELGDGTCCTSRHWAQPVLRSAGVSLDQVVNVAALGADGEEGFAVRSDGTIYAWGENDKGQLAQGGTSPDVCDGSPCSPYAVPMLAAVATPMTNVTDAAAANNAAIMLRADGTVLSVGWGSGGRLGNNGSSDRIWPVAVRTTSAAIDTGTAMADIIALAGSTDSTAALDAGGRVLTWGVNSTGQLGLTDYSDNDWAEPAQTMNSGTLVGAVSVGGGGEDHGVLVVGGNGDAMTTGSNGGFELGDCTRATRPRYDVVRDPCAGNLAPVARWNTQYRADHSTQILSGEWVSDGITTNIYLDFNVSDPDPAETLTTYLEFAPLGTPFSATCGDGTHPNVQTGTPTAVNIGSSFSSSFAVTGLTVGTQYHWRGCVKDSSGSLSAWVGFGTPPDPDFGVDNDVPANPPSVDDGPTRGVDIDETTSLTVIEATWPVGIDGGGSGLVRYDYCVTTIGAGTDCAAGATRTWTSNGYSPDLRATGLSLTNNTMYYVCVRATDGAGNQALGIVCSDGQLTRFSLTSVNPNAGVQGDSSVAVELTGTGFLATDAVAFSGTGITVVSVTRVSDTRLDVVVDIAAGATPGARNVTVSHTGSDTSQVQLGSSFTVVAISISVSLSTLGYSDSARDATPPNAIGFGTVLPGDTRAIGPAGSGQVTVGAATQVTVVSNGGWRLQMGATDWASGANTVGASAFEWKHFGVTEAWTPFSTSAVAIEGAGAGNPANAPGGTTYSYDWRVTVPPTQAPGTYSGTVTYTAIPAV